MRPRRLFRVRRRRAASPSYLKHKEAARRLVHERIAHFNQFYHCTIGRVSIRNQKTRWGSCSRKGNLNFNYRLAMVPSHLADYVIVHEICHLLEFNHGKRFWDLVAKTIPEYAAHRKQLLSIVLSGTAARSSAIY